MGSQGDPLDLLSLDYSELRRENVDGLLGSELQRESQLLKVLEESSDTRKVNEEVYEEGSLKATITDDAREIQIPKKDRIQQFSKSSLPRSLNLESMEHSPSFFC